MSFNFVAVNQTINFRGGSITLRGLSVPDITQLVLVNQATAAAAYANITSRAGKDQFSAEDAAAIAVDLATKFPQLVAHIICLAADEPDGFEAARLLPLDVQVAALEAIANFTFAMSGGLKNFVETVKRIASSVSGLEQNLLQP